MVWAGYIQGIQGAEYLFRFYALAVVLPVMCIAALADGVIDPEMSKGRRVANRAVNGAVLAVLV